MSEYRIAEEHRRFHIEKLAKGNSWDSWIALNEPHVPRYFDSLADARSWVATIKRGVVYHDAEDAIKTPHSVWDEMDEDMLSANVPTGEIVGLLNHWRNKYTITRKDAPNLPVDERKAETRGCISLPSDNELEAWLIQDCGGCSDESEQTRSDMRRGAKFMRSVIQNRLGFDSDPR